MVFVTVVSLIVSWLRPTDRPTMSLIELSWTAKNVSSHFANAFLLSTYHTLRFQKDTLVLHCFWTAHISKND